MFRKNKHVFTCPDVIYLQNRAKKQNRIALAINLIFLAGMLGAGYVSDKKFEREFPKNPDTDTETDTEV